MGIGDEGMLAVGDDIVATTVDMIKEMQDEDSEIVSVYFGEGITKEDADVLASKITEDSIRFIVFHAPSDIWIPNLPFHYFTIASLILSAI